ncbi:hypothetical protein JOM56_013295 [Amanita muscaria]
MCPTILSRFIYRIVSGEGPICTSNSKHLFLFPSSRLGTLPPSIALSLLLCASHVKLSSGNGTLHCSLCHASFEEANVLSLLRGPLDCPLRAYAILLFEALYLRTTQAVHISTGMLDSFVTLLVYTTSFCPVSDGNVLLYELTTLIHMSCPVVVS